jgi:hypothetical protein
MYLDCLQYRKEKGMDECLDESDPQEQFFLHMTPSRFHGVDKKGNPLYIERTGECSSNLHHVLKVNFPSLSLDSFVDYRRARTAIHAGAERRGGYHAALSMAGGALLLFYPFALLPFCPCIAQRLHVAWAHVTPLLPSAPHRSQAIACGCPPWKMGRKTTA